MKEEANWNKQETLDLQVKNSYINIVLKFGKFGSTSYLITLIPLDKSLYRLIEIPLRPGL